MDTVVVTGGAGFIGVNFVRYLLAHSQANILVVDKLTSGAFTASFLDHALRNMNITSLVITGILTDQCVLGTARAAAEPRARPSCTPTSRRERRRAAR